MSGARRTDPWTSWAANLSLPADLRPRQHAVLNVFARHGPMSLSQLLDAYNEDAKRGYHPPQSPSGVRTRASELGEKGRIVVVGSRVNDNHRHEQVLGQSGIPATRGPVRPDVPPTAELSHPTEDRAGPVIGTCPAPVDRLFDLPEPRGMESRRHTG